MDVWQFIFNLTYEVDLGNNIYLYTYFIFLYF